MTRGELIVEDLYDKLHSMERRVRTGDSYPIHKKLRFAEEGVSDIYQWIATIVDLKEGSRILDAGCGVGFGSTYLASQHGCMVTGISLSQSEIEQAAAYSKSKGLGSKVHFVKKSYDSPFDSSFDVIIAVESLKHSVGLEATCKNLTTHLSKGGKLIVVEDFYMQKAHSRTASLFADDWKLVDTYRLEDYYNYLPQDQCEWHDLTTHMSVKSRATTQVKIAFHNMMYRLLGKRDMDVYKIFRGGYYLDKLYADKLMKYGALIYTKA